MPSGEEAIRVLNEVRFPLVLSDIRMLEVSGMGVLSHIKKTGAGSVVILMTGFGTMEGAINAIQEGAFDYISKPFKIDGSKRSSIARRSTGSMRRRIKRLPPKSAAGGEFYAEDAYREISADCRGLPNFGASHPLAQQRSAHRRKRHG